MQIPVLLCAAAFVAAPPQFISRSIDSDFELTADPNARAWKGVPGITAEKNNKGEPVPGHRMEVRSRWTRDNLYLLFVLPYQELYLRDNPSTTAETNKLWEWDVAEAFIGSDFERIHQYKEFQVSPQGEWVDLDIDRKQPKPEGGWLWNSGFEAKARLDKDAKVWYGEMRIPMKSLDPRPAAKGNKMRINLYRIQGPKPERKLVAWQPTGSHNHIPEVFGLLVLE